MLTLGKGIDGVGNLEQVRAHGPKDQGQFLWLLFAFAAAIVPSIVFFLFFFVIILMIGRRQLHQCFKK